jgi:hypothetical protein
MLSMTKIMTFSFSRPGDLEKISKGGRDFEDIIPEIKKPREADGGIHSV